MDWLSLFEYDSENGLLYWRNSGKGVPRGSKAGGLHKSSGYAVVMVNGISYQVHRIIWDIENPNNKLDDEHQVDHIDHNRINNRISNLRKVKAVDNSRNRSKYAFNKSGATGVYFDKLRNNWRAEICVNGKTKHLGRFNTFTEALLVRKDAEEKYGFHQNHGK